MPASGRFVVTGVGGLIGGQVARQLRDLGHRVTGCDSFITGQRRNVPRGIDLVEADCRDLAAMNRLCAGAEVVIHCAATPYEGLSVYSPHFVTDHNFGASSAVFTGAIAGGARRIVFTSSMARYGRGPVPFDEDQALAPVDPYGVAKVASEMLLRSLCELHDREYVVCVPHNVVGPGQRFDDAYRNVAAIMINRALLGEDLVIYGDGEQRRCFTHVLDVADQICALTLASGVSGQAFNLGSDTGFITVNQLAQRVLAVLGQSGRSRHVPARRGEVRDATCSHAKVEAFLGRVASRTLDDALALLAAEVRDLGARFPLPDLPIEIAGPGVPETWMPDPEARRRIA